jgi:hypothetical protein
MPPMNYTVELDQTPGLEQTDERLTVSFDDGRREQMRLHEYDRVYAVPGLYEEVVQRQLECASPTVLASSLVEQVKAHGGDPADLRVLDIGAGNGVVGEELRRHGVTGTIVGMDAAAGARPAAERDRPGLYSEFLVGDLSELPLASLVDTYDLNCLAGAGALGLGHISAASFDAAWQTFPVGSWCAVTIGEATLENADDELGAYLAELRAGGHGTEVVHLSRFRHRLRMSGAPIHYHVLVARRTA